MHKNRNNWTFLKASIIGLFAITLLACSQSDKQDIAIEQIKSFISKRDIDHTKAAWKHNLPMPPQVTFSPDKSYYWLIRTNMGDMKLKLMPDVAPMHVSSTIYLSQLGFYDSLNFHRIISNFMVQGGDPMGNGMGGPGYKYAGEFSVDAKHDKAGILSMANAGANTDGSQFFITFGPTPHLNGRHTVFGELVDGMETLQRIHGVASPGGKPQKAVEITSTLILVEKAAESES